MKQRLLCVDVIVCMYEFNCNINVTGLALFLHYMYDNNRYQRYSPLKFRKSYLEKLKQTFKHVLDSVYMFLSLRNIVPLIRTLILTYFLIPLI